MLLDLNSVSGVGNSIQGTDSVTQLDSSNSNGLLNAAHPFGSDIHMTRGKITIRGPKGGSLFGMG